MWTFAFSAAVVFGTVVTRGPRSPLAQSAMTELEQACVLFTKASVYSIRCTKALAILTKLAEKARHALAAVANDPTPLSDAGGLLWNIKVKQEETEDDELAIFAGHTRFVSVKKSTMTDVTVSSSHTAPAPPPQQPPQQQYQPHVVPSQDPMVGGWSGSEDNSMLVSRPEEHLPPPTLHYPYVQSERTHQLETYNGGGGGGWEDECRSRPQQPQQSYPPIPMQPPRMVPSQYPARYPVSVPQLPPHAQPLPQQHQPPQAYRTQLEPEQYQRYHQYPAHPSHSQAQHQHRHQQQWQNHPHQYAPSQPQQQPQPLHHQPAFDTQTQHLPNAELADLGLAARDSRLDERWSSFMQDSGLLEGLDFRGR